MDKKFLIFFVCVLFKLSVQSPIVLDENLKTCKHELLEAISGNEVGTIEFKSKLWTTISNNKTYNLQIYYTFCDNLSTWGSAMLPSNFSFTNHPCENEKTCLLMSTGKSLGTFGSEFKIVQSDDQTIVTFYNGSFCQKNKNRRYQLQIRLVNSHKLPEDPIIEAVENCVIYLKMLHPDFTPSCTTKYGGQLIDLRPLKKHYTEYFLQTPKRNFSITLCDKCGSEEINNNNCERVNSNIKALSTVFNTIEYIEDKHELVMSAQMNKLSLQIHLVCKNSLDSNTTFHYIEPLTQGKKYKFTLESSLGCIKKQNPPECIVHDQFYIYNLTNLYYGHIEKWTVKNVPHGNIFISICGPLNFSNKNNKLEQADDCTATSAQVCHVLKDKYINKGFLLTNLQIEGDYLRASIENGFDCAENTSKSYRTIITFECSNEKFDPIYQNYSDCTTYINWRTPEACPRYNTTACRNTKSTINNCTFTNNGLYYDLSPLTSINSSYPLLNNNNDSEYYLNICGMVFNEDNPCMVDAAIVKKYVKWVNPKDKVKSMGSLPFNEISPQFITSEKFTLKFLYGSICDEPSFSYYSSEIQFECADNEDLQVISESSCESRFTWKTKHACPKSVLNSAKKDCVFREPLTQTSFDLTNTQETKINVSKDGISYQFDMCLNTYIECSSTNKCIKKELLVNNTLTYMNNSYLIIRKIPFVRCNSKNAFNSVEIETICDKIRYNEHFAETKLQGCILKIKYFTSKICKKENELQRNTFQDTSSSKIDTIKVQHKNSSDMGNTQVQQTISSKMESTTTQNKDSLKIERIQDGYLPQVKSPNPNCSLSSNQSNFVYYLDTLETRSQVFYHVKCPVALWNNYKKFIELNYSSDTACSDPKQKFLHHTITLFCSDKESNSYSQNGECLKKHQYNSSVFCKLFDQHAISTQHGVSKVGLALGICGILLAAIGCFIGLRKYKKYCRNSFEYTSIRNLAPLRTFYTKDGDQ